MNLSLVSAGSQLRTKNVGNGRMYLDPRISANQLAQFIVSSPAQQETIVRNAKYAMTVRLANYTPARIAIAKAYDGNGINDATLLAEAKRMETSKFPDAFETKCHQLSAKALRAFAPLTAQIDCAGTRIARPQQGFPHLMMEGVRVSVQPEVVFSMQHRGATAFGGVIAALAKGEASSLAKTAGKYTAGNYVAFLVFQMLALHFAKQGGPRYLKCFAVDAFRGDVHKTPASHVTMQKNVLAACRNIFRQWNEEADEAMEDLGSEDDWAF
jgi:hypothetical protein